MIRRPPRSTPSPSTTLFRPPRRSSRRSTGGVAPWRRRRGGSGSPRRDRKRTPLKSTHIYISFYSFIFFNDPAPPEIHPLPLHDALPTSQAVVASIDRRRSALAASSGRFEIPAKYGTYEEARASPSGRSGVEGPRSFRSTPRRTASSNSGAFIPS